MFNIVLHEPEKPDNTGNIGRTCVATGSALHLIHPLGFQLSQKNIRHAGLDYWERLKLFQHDNYEAFLKYLNAAPQDVGANAETVGVNACHRGKRIRSPVVGASYASPSSPQVWYATTKAHKSYTDVKFNDGDYIMFGKESAGIPEEILADDEEHCIRIPMIENERSLNLSNAVAIVLYEALRQNNFDGLIEKGELHRLKYKS